MYLSRVEIDRNNRRKIRDLTHVGAYHNWVEQSFPLEFSSHKRSRKLWRLDSLNQHDYLLIVSNIPPDLHRLEKYGVKGTAQTKDYDPFLSSLTNGERARFRVALNPVVSIMNGDHSRGRVVPHVTVDQQMKFLQDRDEKNGFQVKAEDFTIVERGYVNFRRKGQRDIRLSKAVYEGVLTIIDADQFRKTLTEGFGKKKAYGFGMMTVIPLEG